MKQAVIKFLREKKVLGTNETEWNVRFPNGRKLSINELMIDFTMLILENHYCTCGPDSTGWTEWACCNICGKIVESEMKPKSDEAKK